VEYRTDKARSAAGMLVFLKETLSLWGTSTLRPKDGCLDTAWFDNVFRNRSAIISQYSSLGGRSTHGAWKRCHYYASWQ
jgi:hypothetical protein